MKRTPTLSIIVPIYNVEAYLSRCIDSILAQTFTDFELILIDDGSPDRCAEIMEEYAAKDSRIVTIHQKNGGVSAARNAGLDIAQGEYVMFCDSDDTVSDIWASSMLSIAEKYSPSLVSCNCGSLPSLRTSKDNGTVTTKVFQECEFFDYLLSTPIGDVWNKIFKRSIIEQREVRFHSEISYGEDKLFVLDYLLAVQSSFSAIHISEKLYGQNGDIPNSLSKQFNERRYRFLDLEREKLYLLRDKYGLDPDEVNSYVKLKRDIAAIEELAGIVQNDSFPANMLRLRRYVASEAFQRAMKNEDLKLKISKRYYKVLKTNSALIIYLYYIGSRLLQR